jgi:site-specific recombinase XerD
VLDHLFSWAGKQPSQLDIADLDAPLIADFLTHLEQERGNSARTRNARLSAIRSFYQYAALRHPEHAALIARVLDIPAKRCQRTEIRHLDEPEIDALLAAPDPGTWTGRRDHALLEVAVQTGLRVSELTSLRLSDVHLGTGPHVHCEGKGRKERCTPLSRQTVKMLREWLKERGGSPGDPLFPTRWGAPLSRSAVSRVVARHAAAAGTSCPSLSSKRPTPHILRHSCAMSLLKAGCDLAVIALWLGHEQVGTTMRAYLHGDLSIKQRAPANAAITVRRSDLARVRVSARATDPDQRATLELSPMGGSGGPLPLNARTDLGATPAGLVSYRSPGYNWQPIVDLTSPSGEMRDNVLNMTPYGRGHFTERYFAAVLSPPLLNGPSVSVEDRTLSARTWPLLGDPWHTDTTDEVTGMSGLLRLYSGHRLLARSHLGTFGGGLSARIPTARHRYSLHVDGTRTPGAALSAQIHGVWVFSAHGTTNFASFTATLGALRLLPGGLDLRNKAGSGTLTPVTMHVVENSYPPVAITAVRAYMSADDGKTWHAVRVRARSGHYVFTVRDPRQAGFVSLRLYVRDAAGNSESLTVIHAHGVPPAATEGASWGPRLARRRSRMYLDARRPDSEPDRLRRDAADREPAVRPRHTAQQGRRSCRQTGRCRRRVGHCLCHQSLMAL